MRERIRATREDVKLYLCLQFFLLTPRDFTSHDLVEQWLDSGRYSVHEIHESKPYPVISTVRLRRSSPLLRPASKLLSDTFLQFKFSCHN